MDKAGERDLTARLLANKSAANRMNEPFSATPAAPLRTESRDLNPSRNCGGDSLAISPPLAGRDVFPESMRSFDDLFRLETKRHSDVYPLYGFLVPRVDVFVDSLTVFGDAFLIVTTRQFFPKGVAD